MDLLFDLRFRLRKLAIEIRVLQSAIVANIIEVPIWELKQVIVDHEVFGIENSLDVPFGIPRYVPRRVNCISSAPGSDAFLVNGAACTFCWRDWCFIFQRLGRV